MNVLLKYIYNVCRGFFFIFKLSFSECLFAQKHNFRCKLNVNRKIIVKALTYMDIIWIIKLKIKMYYHQRTKQMT